MRIRLGDSGPTCLVLLGATAFFVIQTWIGRFPHTDEAAYKAPGREWAQEGRFAAPESVGWLGNDDLWTGYPPIYPFAFGLFAKVFGFGLRQCVAFDAAIHALQAWLVFRLALAITHKRHDWLCAVAGLASLALGAQGRPDELAICFGLVALLLVIATPGAWRRAAVAGFCLGLCAATSPAAGVAVGLIGTPIAVFRAKDWRMAFTRLSAWGGCGIATAAAIWGPILLASPSGGDFAWQTARNTIDLPKLADFALAFSNGRPLAMLIAGGALVAAIDLIGALRVERRQRQRRLCDWIANFGGATTAIAGLLVLVPERFPYLWYVGVWFLACGPATIGALWSEQRFAGAILAMLALALPVAYGARQVGLSLIFVATLPESQTASFANEKLHELIPPGSVVLSGEHWWFLANDYTMYDDGFSRAPDLDRIDFVVVGGVGDSGELRDSAPHYRDYVREHFDAVYDGIERRPLTLFGRRVQKTARGYGFALLARKKKLEAAGKVAP